MDCRFSRHKYWSGLSFPSSSILPRYTNFICNTVILSVLSIPTRNKFLRPVLLLSFLMQALIRKNISKFCSPTRAAHGISSSNSVRCLGLVLRSYPSKGLLLSSQSKSTGWINLYGNGPHDKTWLVLLADQAPSPDRANRGFCVPRPHPVTYQQLLWLDSWILNCSVAVSKAFFPILTTVFKAVSLPQRVLLKLSFWRNFTVTP